MKRRSVRWAAATIVPLAAGALVWLLWCVVFKWPPSDPGTRLTYALAVAAAVLTVVAPPFVAWASKIPKDAREGSRLPASAGVEIAAPVTNSTVIGGDANNVVVISGTVDGPVSIGELSRRQIPSDRVLTQLLDESWARTRRRLLTLDLADDLIDKVINVLESRPLPDELVNLTPGRILALVGDLGMGKSELADAWYRLSIEGSRDDNRAFPVWIDAKGLSESATLQEVVESRCPDPDTLHRRGCDVVIDELDALSSARTVRRLLDEAAILAEVCSNTRVVVTVRPGYHILDSEQIDVPLLSEDEALRVVGVVSGEQPYWSDLTPEAADSARVPLFALLIGMELRELPRPFNRASLLHRLGARVLNAVSNRTSLAVKRWQIKSAFTKIAVSGALGKSILVSEIDIGEDLVASRVVAEGVHGELVIALPVVQQYFAAQALLEGDGTLDDVAADLTTVTAWRYPLAVALAVGSVDQVSGLLKPLASRYPGIAGWLVDEALVVSGTPAKDEASSGVPWSHDENVMAGQRLVEATKAWTEGLVDLSRLMAQSASDGGLRPLGVAGRGTAFEAVWAPADSGLAEVFELYPPNAPKDLNYPGIMRKPPGWGPGRWVQHLDSGDWAWRWSRDELGKELAKILAHRSLELRSGSYLAVERNWELARSLLDTHRQILHQPLEPANVLQAIRDMKAHLATRPDRPFFTINRGSRFYRTSDLDELEKWCADLRDRGLLVERPAPVPDIMNPQDAWIWSIYSPERMRDLVEVVWREAFVGYSQLAVDHFPRFGYTLARMALGKVKIDGILEFEGGPDYAGGPTLGYRIFSAFPDASMDRAQFPNVQSEILSPETRIRLSSLLDQDEVRRLSWPEDSEWPGMIPRGEIAAAHAVPGVGTEALDIFHEAPATLLAYRWLNEDLARLGWVEGNVVRDN